MTTLAELTTPLSTQDVEDAIYAALEAKGISTTSWKPGSPARAIITGVSIVGGAFSTLQALIAESGFLLLAQGDWLTLVARHVFGVERITGTFATGEIQLDNTGAGVFAVAVDDLIVVNSTTGKAYRNTEPFTIAAFEAGVIVDVRAIEIGSDSTSGPADIDDFQTPLLGVTVTNPTAVVGTDGETDPQLRDRCLAKTGILSPNGPEDAYDFIAKSAVRADGASIGVTRTITIPDGIGGVDFYGATAAGELPGTVGDLGTDLGIVDEDLQTQVAPLAITLRSHTATPKLISVTYELWVRNTTGFTDSEIEDQIETSLIAFMADQPIGGTLITGVVIGRVYKSAIESAISCVFSEDTVIRLVVSDPPGDVDLVIPEAPVLGPLLVIDIHQESL